LNIQSVTSKNAEAAIWKVIKQNKWASLLSALVLNSFNRAIGVPERSFAVLNNNSFIRVIGVPPLRFAVLNNNSFIRAIRCTYGTDRTFN
jgi:hypothetical protein